MTAASGKFVWVELMTPDVAAASEFYAKVVGWELKPSPEYTELVAGDRMIGGMMTLPDEVKAMGVPPHWSSYIGVADISAASQRLTELGGKIIRPASTIPGVGTFAVVTDPQGVHFYLFQSASSESLPAAALGTPGHVGWNELASTDGKAGFEFYRQMFGWTAGDAMDMGPMGIYQLFAIDGTNAGGIMTKPPQMPAPAWLYYFNVADINATATRITGTGGTIILGPMEVPGGSLILNAIDPQGAMFALVQPPA